MKSNATETELLREKLGAIKNLELVHYYCHQQIHSLVQKPNSELDDELSLW
ncbi:hypothetical protein [Nostoc sp.]|uniref:hypothetical protein n=1 Tax=Nostoc sp. TaxID=1180 RepID=UPI002FF0B572